MKYSKLGRTGLDCSRLGFGTWQIGGGRWKGLEQKESIYLLHNAVETGINLFDAAVVYGQYRSEINEERSHSLELLGKAFGNNRRSEIIICLKIGQLDEYSHKARYEPYNMVKQVQQALIQLRTDYVDICLVHAPTLSEIKEGRALSVVQTMQAMGVARFVGYSFEVEPEHAKLALSQEIDVMMLQYNLLDEACADIFPAAHSLGIGMLVGGPFKRGYLSQQFGSIKDLPLEDNYWVWNLRYARKKVEENLKAVKRLKIEAGGSVELKKKALSRILMHQGANCAVVGHRSINEIQKNTTLINQIILEINQAQPH